MPTIEVKKIVKAIHTSDGAGVKLKEAWEFLILTLLIRS